MDCRHRPCGRTWCAPSNRYGFHEPRRLCRSGFVLDRMQGHRARRCVVRHRISQPYPSEIIPPEKGIRSIDFILRTAGNRNRTPPPPPSSSKRRSGRLSCTNTRPGTAPRNSRQCARLLSEWIAGIGLDPSLFGTHFIRRTKATLIYRRTGNMRAAQLLLGHKKIESTVRYLGVEVDDALDLAEKVDV